jgi:hypothetical protein
LVALRAPIRSFMNPVMIPVILPSVIRPSVQSYSDLAGDRMCGAGWAHRAWENGGAPLGCAWAGGIGDPAPARSSLERVSERLGRCSACAARRYKAPGVPRHPLIVKLPPDFSHVARPPRASPCPVPCRRWRSARQGVTYARIVTGSSSRGQPLVAWLCVRRSCEGSSDSSDCF